jgi:hypothetical protein
VGHSSSLLFPFFISARATMWNVTPSFSDSRIIIKTIEANNRDGSVIKFYTLCVLYLLIDEFKNVGPCSARASRCTLSPCQFSAKVKVTLVLCYSLRHQITTSDHQLTRPRRVASWLKRVHLLVLCFVYFSSESMRE